MNIKEIFAKKDGQPSQSQTQSSGGKAQLQNITPEFAQDAIVQMTELEKAGKLSRSIEEYISSSDFLKLLTEFDVKAAVRIFDAEENAKNALEKGKNETLDDIKKHRGLPKSMKNAQAAVDENDYSKMSSAEFEKIKKQLANSARR